MCWNENISLNTFIFSVAVMLFIYYNNEHTQYKIKDFQNKYVYLFFFSFVLMQLLEYFIWKSLKTNNKQMNQIGSIVAWIIVRIMQPITFLLLLPAKYTSIRNILMGIYLTILSYIGYQSDYKLSQFVTSVKDSHIYWDWFYLESKIHSIIISIFYFSFLMIGLYLLPHIIIPSLMYCVYVYLYKNNNWGSLWCWSINTVFLYYLCKLLFVMPFREYNGLC